MLVERHLNEVVPYGLLISHWETPNVYDIITNLFNRHVTAYVIMQGELDLENFYDTAADDKYLHCKQLYNSDYNLLKEDTFPLTNRVIFLAEDLIPVVLTEEALLKDTPLTRHILQSHPQKTLSAIRKINTQWRNYQSDVEQREYDLIEATLNADPSKLIEKVKNQTSKARAQRAKNRLEEQQKSFQEAVSFIVEITQSNKKWSHRELQDKCHKENRNISKKLLKTIRDGLPDSLKRLGDHIDHKGTV